MHRIEVYQFTGKYAVDRDQAEIIKNVVYELVKRNHKVALDFLTVQITTVGFMSVIVSPLVANFPSEHLNDYFAMENTSSAVTEIVRDSIESAKLWSSSRELSE